MYNYANDGRMLTAYGVNAALGSQAESFLQFQKYFVVIFLK